MKRARGDVAYERSVQPQLVNGHDVKPWTSSKVTARHDRLSTDRATGSSGVTTHERLEPGNDPHSPRDCSWSAVKVRLLGAAAPAGEKMKKTVT